MNQKGNVYLYIIIVVFLLVLVGGGAFYLGNKNAQTQSAITPSPIISQETPSPSVSSSNKDTSNWQTYTHKDYHYSIKIPVGFIFVDRNYPYIQITQVNTGHTPGPGLGDITLGMWDPQTTCNTDIECFNKLEVTYQGAASAGSKTEYQTVTTEISGKSVQGIESWSPTLSQGGTFMPSSLGYDYPMSLSGKYFEIKFSIDGYDTKEEALNQKDLINQILSTFTFTNQNQAIDKDFWRSDTTGFSESDLQYIQNLLIENQKISQGYKLAVVSLKQVDGWGEIDTELFNTSTNQPLATEPGYVLLYKDTNNLWNIMYPNNNQFCNKLRQGPPQLTKSALDLFCGN